MEALLAVAVCGSMATALVVSIQNITKLSFEAKRESALSRIIYNRVMFAATQPRIQEGRSSTRVEEWDVEIETEITPITDLVTLEGQEITGLFRIVVKAVWWGDSDYESISTETWRNQYLYAR